MDARNHLDCAVVRNKAEALEFYTEKVGFEKKMDYTNGGYRYVTVGPKGQDLDWPLAGGVVRPDRLVRPVEARNLSPIVMRVDDVRRISAELEGLVGCSSSSSRVSTPGGICHPHGPRREPLLDQPTSPERLLTVDAP